jgi:hypothetical protein
MTAGAARSQQNQRRSVHWGDLCKLSTVIASQRVGANGSRECAPDDRLREAIQSLQDKVGLDCFFTSFLAMTKSASLP